MKRAPRAALAAPLLCLFGACAEISSTKGEEPDPVGFSPEAEACEADRCDDLCVDLATDPRNCGACGRTCLIDQGEAACVDGECALGACDPGWADCDGTLATGCEQEDTCVPAAACSTSCGSVGALDCADPCIPTCAPPVETCDGADDDCDGACDEDLSCRVDVYRSGGPYGHIYGLDPAEAANAGQSIESDPYFYVYPAESAALSPLYRCDKGNGQRFLTLSSTCEIGLAVDLVVGWVATAETCGSVPLYRLYSGTTGDHFYTLSAEERDAAVAVYGYTSEGVAAYVWSGP